MKLSPVQQAYKALAAKLEEYRSIDLVEHNDVEEALRISIKFSARNVFYKIYEVTKDINPYLIADVQKGHYDDWYLHSATFCYVDSNWKITEPGTVCRQCSRVHNNRILNSENGDA